MKLTRMEGIVIRVTEYAETSLIVNLFTPERGKIGLMLKGAKKPRSQLSAVFDFFNIVEVVFYDKEGANLHLCSQATLVRDFPGLVKDLEAYHYAVFGIEVADRLFPPEEKNIEGYRNLLEYLTILNSGEEARKFGLLRASYYLKMLTIAGYEPQLSECTVCHKKEDFHKIFFSPPSGGIVCGDCAGNLPELIEMDEGIRKLLLSLRFSSLPDFRKFAASASQMDAINRILKDFTAYQSLKIKTFN
ncbi:MAG: DNA repair protein RecO [candidate division Zixibacteria bacterium 4484_93]|nr:MAG: DNA repair protein RecO [candidate division Zixibacteria bacterium 4484_93]